MAPRHAHDPRWIGLFFAGIWLAFLVQPIHDVWTDGGVHRWGGLVAIAAFVVTYLRVVWMRRGPLGPEEGSASSPWLLVGMLAALVALAVLVCVAAGGSGVATAPYIAVALVFSTPVRWGWVLGFLVGAGAYTATLTIPGWSDNSGIFFGTSVATLAVWGITRMARYRIENQRLELQEERNRFARDLHDIIGHSLTVVTVKAELAGKLLDVDPERARAEIASIEQLARDALADVRAAVSGYRQITLPGELANAKAALEAAQIEADLPNSTDGVAGDLRELFAWVIREGVTNVIRHSGARRCVVTLDERSVEVRDDGRGGSETPAGNGLRGLRERAASHEATLVTESLTPGFALRLVVA